MNKTKPDYDALLDGEIRAYLATHNSFCDGLGEHPTPDKSRQIYNAAARYFDVPPPKSITFQNRTIAHVPTRRYTATPDATALIIYLHGGGFVLGDLDTHHTICAEICAATNQDVLAVNYRLAPEHPYPAAITDALAVFDTVSDNQPVILVGDSAGATLCASITHLRPGRVAGLALIYPFLDKLGQHLSFVENSDAPILTAAGMLDFERLYLSGQPRPDDVDYRPMAAGDFSTHPPCFISTAQYDPLRDDGLAYHQRIQAAGGVSTLVSEPGLMHGHLRARHVSTKAKAAFDRITTAIAQMAPWNGA